MVTFLAPDFIADKITSVNLDFLLQKGVNSLVIDLDNTLAPRDKSVMDVDCKEWLISALRKGFRISIVSNNWNKRARKALEGIDGIKIIAPAGKPFLRGLKKAMKAIDGSSTSTVLIGDQVFTDIFGAKRLGIRTILVLPLSEYDLFHTKMLRKIETKLINFWTTRGLSERL